jgi:peroxiredoxin
MKTEVMVGGVAVVLLGGTLLLVNLSRGSSTPAPSQPALVSVGGTTRSPEAQALAESLRTPAAKQTSGRLELTTEVSEDFLPSGVSDEALADTARETIQNAKPQERRREKLIFSGETWRREVVFLEPTGKVRGTYHVSVQGGIGKSMEIRGAGDAAPRFGRVGEAASVLPVDQILYGRAGELLVGATWTGLSQEGDTQVLTGRRGAERLTATIRTKPRPALERLLIVAAADPTQQTPPHGQELKVKYGTADAAAFPIEVELLEFTANETPSVRRSVSQVRRLAGTNTPSEKELSLVFQKGTKVVDSSFQPPLTYIATGKPMSDATLQAMYSHMLDNRAEVGKPAPDWKLAALSGGEHALQDYRGKAVLITFFASWCGPCNTEAPVLEKEFWQKYRSKGLTVIGINTNEQGPQERLARAFVQKHGVTYPTLLDKDSAIGQMYRADALPTQVLIDRRGKVVFWDQGFDHEKIEAHVEAALASS